MKAFLWHVYGYFTDEQNEGDFLKVFGASLMVISVVLFAMGKPFDPVAFGSGAGSFATSKALDVAMKSKSDKEVQCAKLD